LNGGFITFTLARPEEIVDEIHLPIKDLINKARSETPADKLMTPSTLAPVVYIPPTVNKSPPKTISIGNLSSPKGKKDSKSKSPGRDKKGSPKKSSVKTKSKVRLSSKSPAKKK
jgi:hypothetical protein